MSSDATNMRGLLAKPDVSQNKCFWLQAIYLSFILILGVLQSIHLVEAQLPMSADDFQRLDAAIVKIASNRQKDSNQIWQQIYFQLHISDLSHLKMTHVDEVSRIILEEVGGRTTQK